MDVRVEASPRNLLSMTSISRKSLYIVKKANQSSLLTMVFLSKALNFYTKSTFYFFFFFFLVRQQLFLCHFVFR